MKESTRKKYAELTQCRSCIYDTLNHSCEMVSELIDEAALAVKEWQCEQLWRDGLPRVDATGCPGWETRFK